MFGEFRSKLSLSIIFVFVFAGITLKAWADADTFAKAWLEERAITQAKARSGSDEYRQSLNSEGDKEEFMSEVDSYYRYMPSRRVEVQPGKVAINEAGLEYSYNLKVFGKLPVEFLVDTKYIGIDETVNEVSLPSYLTGVTFGVQTTLPFFNFNKTYLRIGVLPSFYGEDWDFESSSFRLPVRTFLIYQPNDQWAYVLGVSVCTDYEQQIWPIVGFIYMPNEKLAFNLVPPRPNVSYSLNDMVSLFCEGGATSDEFEVDKHNANNIVLRDVVLRYKEMHLGGGIKFKFNDYIQSSITAGGMFNRSLRYRDALGKVGIKNGLYSEFRVEIQG